MIRYKEPKPGRVAAPELRRGRRVLAAAALGLLPLLGGPARSQQEDPPPAGGESIQIILNAMAERPLLLERTERFHYDVEVRREGQPPTAHTIKGTSKQRVVDVLMDGQPPEWTIRRKYSAWHIDDAAGRRMDPALAGFTIEFRFEVEGPTRISVIGGHRLPEKQLEAIARHRESLNGWMPLLPHFKVGESAVLELDEIHGWLAADLDGEPVSAKATVKAAHPRGPILVLRGDYESVVKRSLGDCPPATVKSTGPITLAWDLHEGFCRQLTLRLAAEIEGSDPGGAKVTGKGTSEIDITANYGPQADRAFVEAPVRRANTWTWAAEGLAFEIPSPWFQASEEDGKIVFQSAFDAPGGARLIEIQTVPDGNPARGLYAARMEIERDHRTRGRSVRHALGNGYAYDIASKERCLLYHIYADRDRFVHVRLIDEGAERGPASAKDMEVLISSLRRP